MCNFTLTLFSSADAMILAIILFTHCRMIVIIEQHSSGLHTQKGDDLEALY